MKNSILVLLISAGLFSCTNTSSNESVAQSDSISKKPSIEEETQSNKKIEDTTFLIQSKKAGAFAIGKPINSLEASKYQLIKTKELRSTDEGQEEIPMMLLINGKDKILSAYQEFDYGKSEYSNTIGELRIFSPLFHTEKQITPASRISEVFAAYPNAKIYYTYISNQYWIETPELPSLQFILNGDDYKGDKNAPVESEITELRPSDFPSSSKVQYIRIYN